MPKVQTPEPGSVVEQVTRTRVVPTEENDPGPGKDAFNYMSNISEQAWNDGNHLIYLYRTEPAVYRNGNEPLYVGKYSNRLTEEDIQRECGGGRFKIIVKRGLERVGESRCQCAGTPRDLSRTQQEFDPTRPGGVPATDSNSVVSQALTAATNPAAQAAQVEMMKTAATAAVEMVKNNAPHQMSTAEIIALAKELSPKQAGFLEGPFGPIAIAVVTKLVDKLFTDPTEQFVKMAELMSKFGGGSGASDWKAALVDAAPKVINGITSGLHELRLGAEAQRTPPPLSLPAAPAPVTSTPNNVVTMPPAAATPTLQHQPPLPGTVAPAGPQRMEVPMQFIWQKIFEFMNDSSKTGRDIGEWLDDLDPSFIASVKDYSIEQVTTFVNANPSIAFVAQHPRFRQCLTELLAWANEVDTTKSAI